MFSFFKNKEPFYHIDIHSHLIPGIDDGVDSWDESLSIISRLHDLGINKIITTPHIIHGFYPNTPEAITDQVNHLNKLLQEQSIAVKVEAGAEYYVDEHFVNLVENNGDILSFGNQYVLVETPFMNKPIILESVLFELQAKGYQPILAHPERYDYFQKDYELIDPLLEKGILLQLNINSLVGYYSKEAQKLAEYLIKKNAVSFLGSDIHNHKHLAIFEKAIKSKNFEKCRQLNLHNKSL